MNSLKKKRTRGLYDVKNNHDNCGIGFLANINGEQKHSIVLKGIEILERLVHRGALGGDMKTGDGSGILTQIPHDFYVKVTKAEGITLPAKGEYGIGMFFISQDNQKAKVALAIIEKAIKAEGTENLGVRKVPTNSDSLGEIALRDMPQVYQFFVKKDGLKGEELERKLYIIRKVAENSARKEGLVHADIYATSFSSQTIVHKGLLTATQIKTFYPDLVDEDFVSALALVHQRYSTNTFPSWPLAQPFRYLAHNGEINTLSGNINKIELRESNMVSTLLGDDLQKIYPVVDPEGSDSSIFDNAYELVTKSGRSLEHAMMMMVPEAFGENYHISRDKRAFYDFHATFMEPWDGPAALIFTDGKKIGGTLDRNGLRPSRFTETKSGLFLLASESGVLDINPEDVKRKGRLQPGKMTIVDLEQKRVLDDVEIKAQVSRQQPYRRWIEDNRIFLKGFYEFPKPTEPSEEHSQLKQKIFGYDTEIIEDILHPMAATGQEPTNSMGADVPLAVFSKHSQPLFNYFKQRFAQVTNPPIDPIREGLVMSLMGFLGEDRNLLIETPQHCRKLKLPHPILTNEDLAKIKNNTIADYKVVTLNSVFPANGFVGSMEKALDSLFKEAEKSITDGATVIVLSDRTVDKDLAPIPSLLALSGLNNHLKSKGLRHKVGLIVESGEPKEVMHFALLIGYGANGINPYLAFETLILEKINNKFRANLDIEDIISKYITAIKKGLLKIFSKMGISTLRSYRAAQIFEAIGLNEKVINKYFTNTASRMEGLGLEEIQKEALAKHSKAFEENIFTDDMLSIGGQHRLRVKNEKHLWTPTSISNLQKSTRLNDYGIFKKFSGEINNQSEQVVTIRGLMKFKIGKSISIDEVEPVTEIVKRFVTGAMSHGSISQEVHEAMAVAMNRLGGQSNTGEGGENPERFKPRADGTSARSSIKQVASGRFGVTSEYLANSDEIQIKMAQGAKPGEGGQLPGHKVNSEIASIRNSTEGVTLISPPPHHDIYSIEDIAQLIFDLHNANPKARVSVKLVSEIGVGTIAAGIAKAKADMVLISGFDGGTGASPLSSIQHAGSPWEIGLAETQQTLVTNMLRDKIRVQTDGQLRTGRDVAIASLLGADEFGFATTPLVTQGCVMMRKCHSNNCPVGIATQNKELRKRFAGSPDYLVNYFNFVAEEVREIMAALGFKTMKEMTGRADMLEKNEDIITWKTKGIDFSKILYTGHFAEKTGLNCNRKLAPVQDESLDSKLLVKLQDAIDNKTPIIIDSEIKNSDRSMGAMIGNAISKKYGMEGLSEDTITINLHGYSGQSFGAFLPTGVTVSLKGEVNDYLGKGLSGGRIIVAPPEKSSFKPEENIIAGNTSLYGAIGGQVFLNGIVGERFAVRNSGATAVVEGLGDHGCEYMTGGIVVVLGKTGRNFAAGMSGGVAYVLDDNQLFDTKCNLDMVEIEPLIAKEDIDSLRNLIELHFKYTGSKVAEGILADFTRYHSRFVKVMPMEYKKALMKQRERERDNSDNVSVTEEDFGKNG